MTVHQVSGVVAAAATVAQQEPAPETAADENEES